MHSLILDNIPTSLFTRIQHLAQSQHQTPAAVVIEVLESALPDNSTRIEPPSPSAPFVTEDVIATEQAWETLRSPRPEGEIVDPSRITKVENYLPLPHDIPDEE